MKKQDKSALLPVIVLLVGCGSPKPSPLVSSAPARASAPISPKPVSTSASTPALTSAPTTSQAPTMAFTIGDQPELSHVYFEAPPKLTFARIHVVVDRAATVGLNFFAIQVDFNNGTWAHGGLQDVDGPDNTRQRQVNWGGLVDRGGGNDDYEKQDDAADLEKIQNPPAGQHIGPYAWKTGVEYEYTVERGASITLPAGDYRMFPESPPVHIDHPRTLWEWRFTIQPTKTNEPSFVSVLYNTADAFDSFCVWNEAGYGSTQEMMHTSWSSPLAGVSNKTANAPSSWGRD